MPANIACPAKSPAMPVGRRPGALLQKRIFQTPRKHQGRFRGGRDELDQTRARARESDLPMTYRWKVSARSGRKATGDDVLVQAVGLSGGLDSEDDRQELAAAPKRVERLRLMAGRGERTHEAAVERLGEVVGLDASAIDIDGRRP